MNMAELFLSTTNLAAYGRERGLSKTEIAADPAYVVHCWLAEALGPSALRPFTAIDARSRIRVLGYSDETATGLTERLTLNASPSVAHVLTDPIRSKAMPRLFKCGDNFDFEVRLQPTRKGPGKSEKDAFLLACSRVGTDVTVNRAQVYHEYLAERLEASASLMASEIVSFTLAPVARKQVTEGRRRTRLLQVPQALIRGQLVVKEPSSFVQTLRNGVGRGRGMGFGMLLLRRP